MAWSPASKVGDTDIDIPAAKQKLAGNTYGKPIGTDRSNVYTAEFGAALTQYGANVNAQIDAGKRVPATPRVNGGGVFDWTVKAQMRIGKYAPPPPRHAALTVRGTGGVIDLDPTSVIADNSSNHYEVPINYAAAMGGLPVGAAVDPNAPSGDECADQVQDMLTQWVLTTTATFSIFGYSLGSKGVVQFLNELFRDGSPLAPHRDRLVSVVLVADPWRPFGHTFFLGPIPDGQGIGAPYFTMSPAAVTALGWRCCWLANPADLYTNAPLGATGQVLADVEEIVLGTAISDPLGTIQRAIPHLLQLLQTDSGLFGSGQGSVGNISGTLGILASVASGSLMLTGGLVGLLLPLLQGGFTGILAGVTGNGQNLQPGVAADVQAAILALKFFGSGTAPHISYGTTPWSANGPQTYIELAIQHANDWGARVPVRT